MTTMPFYGHFDLARHAELACTENSRSEVRQAVETKWKRNLLLFYIKSNWNPKFTLFYIILSAILPFCSHAQILRVHPEEIKEHLYTSEAYFNDKFIALNQIKSINGQLQIKKDLQPIQETQRSYYYGFDKAGMLIQQFEIYPVSNQNTDTTFFNYLYNPNGQIQLKRTNDAQGFFSYKYEYNTNQKITGYRYSRDSEKKGGKSIVVFSETYEYTDWGENTYQRKIINDIGKCYKEEVFEYDKFDNLIEQSYQFVVTGKKGITTYEYDYYGRLLKKTEHSRVIKKLETITVFEYDKVGNLLSEKVSLNGKLIKTKEFLYDKQMLLTAQLTKDEASGTIEILKFTYEFY